MNASLTVREECGLLRQGFAIEHPLRAGHVDEAGKRPKDGCLKRSEGLE